MESTIPNWTKNWLIKKGVSFHFLEIAESSNDWAKKEVFKNPDDPVVFLVAKQTKGRGRRNAKWENSDLMISILWKKNLKKITVSSCSDFTSDLFKALKKVWPDLALQIKAPNDLYLNQKKMAGILLEIVKQGPETAFILGLGLNVFSCPKKLRAACLAEEIKNINSTDWESFLNHLFSFWSRRIRAHYYTDSV